MKGPISIQWRTRSRQGAPVDDKWSLFCKVLPGHKNQSDEGAAGLIVRALNNSTHADTARMEFRTKEPLS